jgi:hypothetical protein
MVYGASQVSAFGPCQRNAQEKIPIGSDAVARIKETDSFIHPPSEKPRVDDRNTKRNVVKG